MKFNIYLQVKSASSFDFKDEKTKTIWNTHGNHKTGVF